MTSQLGNATDHLNSYNDRVAAAGAFAKSAADHADAAFRAAQNCDLKRYQEEADSAWFYRQEYQQAAARANEQAPQVDNALKYAAQMLSYLEANVGRSWADGTAATRQDAAMSLRKQLDALKASWQAAKDSASTTLDAAKAFAGGTPGNPDYVERALQAAADYIRDHCSGRGGGVSRPQSSSVSAPFQPLATVPTYDPPYGPSTGLNDKPLTTIVCSNGVYYVPEGGFSSPLCPMITTFPSTNRYSTPDWTPNMMITVPRRSGTVPGFGAGCTPCPTRETLPQSTGNGAGSTNVPVRTQTVPSVPAGEQTIGHTNGTGSSLNTQTTVGPLVPGAGTPGGTVTRTTTTTTTTGAPDTTTPGTTGSTTQSQTITTTIGKPVIK